MRYFDLVRAYEKLDSTSKRLEKTYIVSEILKITPSEDLGMVTLLIQGKVHPDWDEREIGIASKTALKAVANSAGIAISEVEKEWKNTGDLGKAAEKIVARKSQSTLFQRELSARKVFSNLEKLSGLEGKGSSERKISLVAELLASAKPLEARYIIKTILEEMRFGVGEGVMRDAIAWAFFPKVLGIFFRCGNCSKIMPNVKKCIECSSMIEGKKEIKESRVPEISSADELYSKDFSGFEFVSAESESAARGIYNHIIQAVQEAYDISNDFSVVARTAKERGLNGLKEASLVPGRPIRAMLAQKVDSIEEGLERVGRPAQVEYKLDGFRIQVHKHGSKIMLFTRRLENVTRQFPDVVQHVKEHVSGDSFILDTEAAGYSPKTKRYLPFQKISQRIKRKYDINSIAGQFPVEVNVFDVMFYNGKSTVKEPLSERRKIIEKIVSESEKKILCVRKAVCREAKEVLSFYEESLKMGNEGIMMKSLDAGYKPGSRVGQMVKFKPVMETLDLVVVGAEWGEGKRSEWLSSFALACCDEDGNFLEIGRASTGLKEKSEKGVSFTQLTEELRPLVINEKGREVEVRPRVVVEVGYEEIQKSTKYSSGYALRFPRIIGLRHDRSAKDCSKLSAVISLYKTQRHRN